MYHPRGYIRPEDGGAMVEYNAIVNHVTMWNVAVERQIQVVGPEAEAFVNYVITRDATCIEPMKAKYVILCNQRGGVLNDPILLRFSENEFWFSLADSDIMFWLQGVNVGKGYNVEIAEIDVSPLQIQGPKSEALMSELIGPKIHDIPYYGLLEGKVADHDVVVSQSGFPGEKGYEIYLRDATLHAEDLWNAVLEAGKKHSLMVIAPAHHRRIAAGILSWGQDMDSETLPFQCNLGYQVPRNKNWDYVGKEALETARQKIEAGNPPFKTVLVGMMFGGKPIDDYAADFWLISGADGSDSVGYVTSPWYSPELKTNIAMGYVPWGMRTIGTKLKVHLPDEYAETPGVPIKAEVVEIPFRPSINPSARELAKIDGRDATF
jgi:aminomethyltransferase